MNIQLLTLLEVYFLKLVYTNNFFKALSNSRTSKAIKDYFESSFTNTVLNNKLVQFELKHRMLYIFMMYEVKELYFLASLVSCKFFPTKVLFKIIFIQGETRHLCAMYSNRRKLEIPT